MQRTARPPQTASRQRAAVGERYRTLPRTAPAASPLAVERRRDPPPSLRTGGALADRPNATRPGKPRASRWPVQVEDPGRLPEPLLASPAGPSNQTGPVCSRADPPPRPRGIAGTGIRGAPHDPKRSSLAPARTRRALPRTRVRRAEAWKSNGASPRRGVQDRLAPVWTAGTLSLPQAGTSSRGWPDPGSLPRQQPIRCSLAQRGYAARRTFHRRRPSRDAP